MATRERILETAIALFNERGTRRATTRHIAAEMGISPGNLYYHFSNKEEIIREIFKKMITFMDNAWTVQAEAPPSFSMMETMLNKVFRLQHDYRFFHFEIISLLQRDPELKSMYTEIRQKRLTEISDFMLWMMDGEIIRRDLEAETLANLVDLTWFVGNFWMVQSELSEQSFETSQIRRGILLISEIFLPYLTERGRKALQSFKKGWE